jgi:hypothetical protein
MRGEEEQEEAEEEKLKTSFLFLFLSIQALKPPPVHGTCSKPHPTSNRLPTKRAGVLSLHFGFFDEIL